MTLEDLKRQFIVTEDVLATQLEPAVLALKDHVLVTPAGDILLLNAESPVRKRIQLALAARFVASMLDPSIRASVTLDEMQQSVRVRREQLRARLSELVKERFAESRDDGTYALMAHTLTSFVRGLSQERDPSSNVPPSGRRRKQPSGKRAERSRVGGRRQLSEIVEGLIGSEFFGEPQDLGAIQQALAAAGHHYPATTLSATMLRQVRKRNLRRLKQGKRWVYVKA